MACLLLLFVLVLGDFAKAVLNPPNNRVYTPGNNQVSMTWTAVGSASGYNVYRSTTSSTAGFALLDTTSTNSYSDTTAVNGTSYWYKLSTLDSASAEGSLSSSSAAIVPYGVPATPINFSVSVVSDQQITLNWGTVYGASSYQLEQSTDQVNWTVISNSISKPVQATGLTSQTTYYFRVRASNVYGDSSWTSTLNGRTKVPAPVVSGSAGNAQVTLTWAAVPNAISYSVLRKLSTDSGYTSLNTNGLGAITSYTNTGLTNDTSYDYIVRANTANSVEQSANSNVVTLTPSVSTPTATPVPTPTVTPTPTPTATPVPVPTAPAGLAATPYNSKVGLSWNAVTGATGYNIYRSTTSNTYASTPSFTVGAVTTYTDTSATNNTQYYYVVRALNANNVESANSNEAEALPHEWASIQLTALAGDGTVTLEWAPSDDVTSYKVYQNSGSGSTLLATVTPTIDTTTTPPSHKDTKYTVTGLTNGTTYSFSVIGYNGAQIATDPSNPISATPQLGGGSYNGVDDLTWVWGGGGSATGGVNEWHPNGSGEVTSIIFPGPHLSATNVANKASVNGPGDVLLFNSVWTEKIIDWYWQTSDPQAYPAPVVVPNYGFTTAYIRKVQKTPGADAHAGGGTQWKTIETGAEERFFADSATSNGITTAQGSKVYVGYARSGSFTTSQFLSAYVYMQLNADNSSDSASVSVGFIAGMSLYLFPYQP